MIIVMSPKATQENIDRVIERLHERGLTENLSKGAENTIIGVIGDRKVISGLEVGMMDGVEKTVRITEKYKLVSRNFHPRIRIPLVHLSKAQIVSLALGIGVPLELTWSCYEREDAACGLCDSCLLRLKGFAGAGAKDKIPYAIEA